MIRLDAVGCVVKKPGTSCFFVEPEIYEFLNWLRGLADPLGMELLPELHVASEVDICLERGANLSRTVSPSHHDADGFDVHQVRCSYYSALGENDDAYLAARAIQFFAPGVPEVYYAGLLAGRNDDEAVRRTGEGREINRHNYSASRGPELKMEWQKDGAACALTVDFSLGRGWIEHVDAEGSFARGPLARPVQRSGAHPASGGAANAHSNGYGECSPFPPLSLPVPPFRARLSRSALPVRKLQERRGTVCLFEGSLIDPVN